MKRDYRSFPQESKKIFLPLVKELGFSYKESMIYTRENEIWNDTIMLQTSSYNNGTFCINVGINIPRLEELWGEKNSYALIISSRLSENGLDDSDCWLPANNKNELKNSLNQFAQFLRKSDIWFKKYNSIEKIAAYYFYRRNLKENHFGKYVWADQLSVANYGLLLLISGNISDAIDWLREAKRLMSLPVYWSKDGRMLHEREKYSRIQKPSKEEIKQLELIQSVIKQYAL